jgi:hypothetical protein
MLTGMGTTRELGASFSLHRCSELGINKQAVLKAALQDLGLRRFRLMSYWNIHEQQPGKYNFAELDWQLDLIAKYGGTVSLCLGKRQPRWPECHIPQWAAALPQQQWYAALYQYIETVVERYKNHPALASWQLENEALLKTFGHCVDKDYSHSRLKAEYRLVKSLDSRHPIIMTLSDSWGLPWRRPNPDAYALSLYRITINQYGKYVFSKRPPLFYKLRAAVIQTPRRKQVFVHELQAEPWLSKGVTETPLEEQFRYLSPNLLKANIAFAVRTDLTPIDLWGLEWWYWLKETQNQPQYWNTIKNL